jgi:hypothetical protein
MCMAVLPFERLRRRLFHPGRITNGLSSVHKVTTRKSSASRVSLPSHPTTGIAACCARATRGHAAAAEQRDELAPLHSITLLGEHGEEAEA